MLREPICLCTWYASQPSCSAVLSWRQVLCQDTSGVLGIAPTVSLLAAGKNLPPPRDTSLALCGRWPGCCRLTAVIIAAYRFLTSWTQIQALLRHAGLSWCLLYALTLRGDPHRWGGGDFFEEPHLCCILQVVMALPQGQAHLVLQLLSHTPQGSSTSGESG